MSDGNNVFNFHLPEGEKHDADFPVTRMDDLAIHQLEDEKESSGTAQVHRADPGSIYFTLQDGKQNPTYTMKHIGGKNWKAIPKRKVPKTAEIIPEYLFLGAKEAGFGDDTVRFLSNQAYDAASLMRAPGMNPMGAALVGAGIGGAYDIGKRTFYNSKEENKEESPIKRALRYILPATALGGIGAAEASLIPNHYRYHPTYDASYDPKHSSFAPR